MLFYLLIIFFIILSITLFNTINKNEIDFYIDILIYISLIPNLAISSRRLHDININAKLYIIITLCYHFGTLIYSIISFVNSEYIVDINQPTMYLMKAVKGLFDITLGIFGLIMFFRRGTSGPNKYGDQPKY